MTDNEIIKALECCGSNGWGEKDERPCDKCPMQDCENCEVELPDYALNLVNRQKAEIERLKKDNEYIIMQHKFDRRPNGDCWNDVIEKAKSEAVKEFAKYLIDNAETGSINISDLPDLVAEFKEAEDNNK